MSGSESNLWERLRKGLSPFGHLQRIEVGLTVGAGIPDVNFCFSGNEGWIELKHGDPPVRASTVVFKSQRGLDPDQIDWLVYRRKCGGRAWIFIQLGKWLLLFDGIEAPKINHCTTQQLLDLAIWKRSGAMHEADWKSLVEMLLKRLPLARQDFAL